MFSSNQVFQVSGSLDSISSVIDFAVRHSGHHEMFTRSDHKVRAAYQITETGLYCLGKGTMEGDVRPPSAKPDSWINFPFDYDPNIIAPIVEQWIRKQPRPSDETEAFDGSHAVGFLCIEPWNLEGNTFDYNIKDVHRCIVCFKPFLNFYAK